VHEAIEGPIHLTCCQEEHENCEQFEVCNIKGPMSRVQVKLLQFISALKLSDFRQPLKTQVIQPIENFMEIGVAE
jgi:DNA-binding IscR family transcriptional regulator